MLLISMVLRQAKKASQMKNTNLQEVCLFISMLRKIQKKPLNLQKIYMSDDLAKSGGELEKIGLVPLSDDKLKASQNM